MKIFSPLLSDVLRAGTRDSRGTNVIPRELLLISSGLRLWTLGSAAFHNETENGDRGRELSGTDSLQKKKKRNSDRRSFRRRSGRSKALLAESGREGRWYRRALISFTDECEMTSSVVWTHTRRHYTLLYPDPPFLSRSPPARRQLQAKKNPHCSCVLIIHL